jgi:hypothetical protein
VESGFGRGRALIPVRSLAEFLEIGFGSLGDLHRTTIADLVGPISVSCIASGDAAQSPELTWSL